MHQLVDDRLDVPVGQIGAAGRYARKGALDEELQMPPDEGTRRTSNLSYASANSLVVK